MGKIQNIDVFDKNSHSKNQLYNVISEAKFLKRKPNEWMGYVFILFYIMPCWSNITKSEGSGEQINGICLCIFRRKEIMHRYLNKIRLFNKKN